MGDYKKAFCQNGHPLVAGNLYWNAEGFRECRSCKILREQRRKAEIRKARKAAQEVSDAELDRRALVMMGRTV